MEQDEDADAYPGRRARGDVGIRADGAGAGATGDGRAIEAEPGRTLIDARCPLFGGGKEDIPPRSRDFRF